MSASVPRLSGFALRAASRLLRSEAAGPPLRRFVGGQVVDRNLAGIDFAAEGDPAPLYVPPRFRPGARGDGR